MKCDRDGCGRRARVEYEEESLCPSCMIGSLGPTEKALVNDLEEDVQWEINRRETSTSSKVCWIRVEKRTN